MRKTKDGICNPIARQGPEGHPPNVSPARKRWVWAEDDLSAGGAALTALRD